MSFPSQHDATHIPKQDNDFQLGSELDPACFFHLISLIYLYHLMQFAPVFIFLSAHQFIQ